MRLIHHEASKTFTIRQVDGLERRSKPKLYASYVLSNDAREVTRHRGTSPAARAFFSATGMEFHAAQLRAGRDVWVRVLAREASAALRVGVAGIGGVAVPRRGHLEMHKPVNIPRALRVMLLAGARHDEVGIARCAI